MHDATQKLIEIPKEQSQRPAWAMFVSVGVTAYLLTSLVAIVGVQFSREFVKPRSAAAATATPFVDSFAKWDGVWYKRLANEGYIYNAERPSNVAFFPVLALFGRGVAELLDCSAAWGLMIVAHIALAAAFVAMAAYLNVRVPESQSVIGLALVAFGLWPTTFFWRMTYSESLFVLMAVVVFYGLVRRWPLWIIALIIGAATATRPVGVALLPVLAMELWRRSPSFARFALKASWCLPLACWGLLAFMAYQWIEFDEPLAFAKTQSNWRVRRPLPFLERADSLAILEPAWSVFDPLSPCFWGNDTRNPSAVFNLRLANPIYFTIAVILIGVGAWKRWLNANEIVLSAGLLLIPYLTRAHEMCFCSMGRFAAVAFPLYIVMGQLLSRLPIAVAGSLLAISGFFMGAYAALFAAGYPLF